MGGTTGELGPPGQSGDTGEQGNKGAVGERGEFVSIGSVNIAIVNRNNINLYSFSTGQEWY